MMASKFNSEELEEMAQGAQALRDIGIDPASSTAAGTIQSIRDLLPIFTPRERSVYLVAVLNGVLKMVKLEASTQTKKPTGRIH